MSGYCTEMCKLFFSYITLFTWHAILASTPIQSFKPLIRGTDPTASYSYYWDNKRLEWLFKWRSIACSLDEKSYTSSEVHSSFTIVRPIKLTTVEIRTLRHLLVRYTGACSSNSVSLTNRLLGYIIAVEKK